MYNPAGYPEFHVVMLNAFVSVDILVIRSRVNIVQSCFLRAAGRRRTHAECFLCERVNGEISHRLDAYAYPLTLVLYPVYHLDHHIDLVHGGTVEVFPHGKSQLILRDSSFVLFLGHRRALSTDAGVREECLSPGRGERCRRRQVVRCAVRVKQWDWCR